MNGVDPKLLAQLRKLYPSLSEAQLVEAAENLMKYFNLIARIYERICNDPEEHQ